MTQRFDKFMVYVGIGTNRKLRRLPVAERWVYVAGILALAAQSPLRGALLISDGEHVTAKDIAEEATVSTRVAQSALDSFTRLGMLNEDEHGVLWVHDWDKANPDPKPSDSPAATRERKRKQRAEARAQASVTPLSRVTPPNGHAPEVEDEEEETPLCPPGDLLPPVKPVGGRGREIAAYRRQMDEWVQTHFPGCQTSAIEHLVGWVPRGIDPTPDAVREFASAAPNFTHLLEPAA